MSSTDAIVNSVRGGCHYTEVEQKTQRAGGSVGPYVRGFLVPRFARGFLS
jgi:hypothetical protein